LWFDRIHPQDRSRQSLRQFESAGRPADPARQHPGSWLLPLTQSDAGERTLRVNRKTKGETMLTHPTHDRMVALGLTGMAKALEEQRKQPDIATLGCEERSWSTARPSSARTSDLSVDFGTLPAIDRNHCP